MKLGRKRYALFSERFPYEPEKFPTMDPNPYEFWFLDEGQLIEEFVGMADGRESCITDVAYARRLGRLTQKLTRKEPKSQMLRTLIGTYRGTYTKRPRVERREIDHAQKKSRSIDADVDEM